MTDASDDTPVMNDPRGHSFEPFDGISNAQPAAACRYCSREAAEHPTVKCGTQKCSEATTVRAYWPGKTIDFCTICAVRAVSIADAMGFALTVAPLPSTGLPL